MKWALVLIVVATAALADTVKFLDAKWADQLRAQLKKQPIAQRMLVPSTCRLVGKNRYHCKKRSCDVCNMIEARCDVTIGKVLSVRNVQVKSLGDTGQCGDCMLTE